MRTEEADQPPRQPPVRTPKPKPRPTPTEEQKTAPPPKPAPKKPPPSPMVTVSKSEWERLREDVTGVAETKAAYQRERSVFEEQTQKHAQARSMWDVERVAGRKKQSELEARATGAEQEVSAHKETIAELKREGAKHPGQQAEWQRKIRGAQARLNTANSQLQAARKQIGRKDAEYRQAEQRHVRFKAGEAERHEQELTQRQERMRAAEEGHATEKRGWTDYRKTQESQRATLEASNQKLVGEMQVSQKTVAQLQSENKQAVVSNRELASRIAQAEKAAVASLQNMRHQKETLAQTIREKEDALAQLGKMGSGRPALRDCQRPLPGALHRRRTFRV